MNVRIVKATEQTFWYARYVGETFPVVEIHRDHKNGDWTVDDGNFSNLIKKRDCEVVK